MSIIYFLVGFIATTLGAVAGLGGGIIIKPVLDLLGHYDLASISILSSATVFSMSVVSLGKALGRKVKFKGIRTLMMAVGSIAGGSIGKSVLLRVVENWTASVSIQAIQSAMLAGLLLMVLIVYNRRTHMGSLNLSGSLSSLAVGLVLGFISSFLGIGGGPINVVVLAIFFSMGPKEAAIHSILIIFFSQLSGLVKVSLQTGFSVYNLEMLVFMIVGGISGGFLGATLQHSVSEKYIVKVFNTTVACIILLNLFNLVKYL